MRPVPFWRDIRKLAVLLQVLFIVALVAGAVGIRSAVVSSLARRNIRLDWGFIRQPAGFDLTQLGTTLDLETLRLKPYEPEDSYAEAMIAGLLNTVKVAAVGIVAALAVGVVVGVARLSRNWLVARLALIYVEALRNTPLLVQLLFWYLAVFLQLPGGGPGDPPIRLFGDLVVLSNQGLAIGATLSERFGRMAVDGGVQFQSEYAALLLGLSVYTSAFIAEIVRGGILAVPRGQREAALSVGLRESQAMRLVVLPQALRIVIPPIGNQFLNLTKNSSLAIAIGYAELLTVTNTVSSQSFRALEAFSVATLTYLALSLGIAAALNLIRARLAVPGY